MTSTGWFELVLWLVVAGIYIAGAFLDDEEPPAIDRTITCLECESHHSPHPHLRFVTVQDERWNNVRDFVRKADHDLIVRKIISDAADGRYDLPTVVSNS